MSAGGGPERPAFYRWDDASRERAGWGHGKITSVLGAYRSPVPSLLCGRVQGGWLL